MSDTSGVKPFYFISKKLKEKEKKDNNESVMACTQQTLPRSSHMEHIADPRVGNFAIGRHYQLLDVIGEGAYGIVW